ncbi:glycosyltransferase family 4 protein [Stenotrophomonas indicatrix]|uniref:glycosyltransferase family 4 protein n=1 Tax=Stenotrophomonas indicatrix TaxID=2045451 RepID=UPI00289FACB7|nr:glycosyltransferase family 4 protein [Stenotrophomonas indicatrix]
MTRHALAGPSVASVSFSVWIRRGAVAAYRALLPQHLRERIRQRRDRKLFASVSFGNLGDWPAPATPPVPGVLPATDSFSSGANLLGYISGQFGLGVSARAYSSALLQVGYPVTLIDSDIDIPHSRADRSLAGHVAASSTSFDTTVVFVNPDQFDAAIDSVGRQRLGRRVIGCWFWELPQAPEAWRGAIEQVDEIVVATAFVAEAFRAVTDKPVTRIPFPLLPAATSALTRGHLGLPDDAYVFLCTFDCNSSLDRKNPEGVINAFLRAFPADRNDVRLLLKSSNGMRNPELLRRLAMATQGDPRIMLRDGVIDVSHVNALQALSDCYVSLHRAEGLGLGMAECMRLGKPVIATAWSGNRDFMDEGNSFLVDYSLVPVRPGQYPHAEGQVWAEPDIDHAAKQMQRVVADPEHALRVAQAGRATILQDMSLERTGRLFATHLDRSSGLDHADRDDAADNEAAST